MCMLTSVTKNSLDIRNCDQELKGHNEGMEVSGLSCTMVELLAGNGNQSTSDGAGVML